MKNLFLFLLLVVGAIAQDIYPPTDRLGVWTPGTSVGVVGDSGSGAPRPFTIGTTRYAVDYGFNTSGDIAYAGSNTGAIANAIADSAETDMVVLPAGSHWYVGLNVPYEKRNLIIKGPGSAICELKLVLASNGRAYEASYGHGANWGNSYNPSTTLTATSLTRGTNILQVADGSNFIPGTICRIKFKNSKTVPVMTYFDNQRHWYFLCANKSSNTITTATPIPNEFVDEIAAGNATVECSQQTWRIGAYVGLEGVTLNCSSDPTTFANLNSWSCVIQNSYGSWMYDVVIKNHKNYGLFVTDSSNITLRTFDILAGAPDPGGGISNHSGLLFNNNSNCLVEDGVYTGNGPDIEINFGSSNNVFAYVTVGVFNVNHGPHNQLNLGEGVTILGYMQSDGYFGGQSKHTYHRCFYRSGNIGSRKRWTYQDSIFGGSVGVSGTTYATDYSDRDGLPNIGNESFTGYSSLNGVGGASPWPDWDASQPDGFRRWNATVTSATDPQHITVTFATGTGAGFVARMALNGDTPGNGNTVCSIQNNAMIVDSASGDVIAMHSANTVASIPHTPGDAVSIMGGPPTGFQQKDLDVNASVWRKHVYFMGAIDHPLTGGETMPASLYRSAKPDFLGNKPWPCIESQAYSSTDAPTSSLHRYLFNNTDYMTGGGGGGGSAGTLTTVNASINAIR